MKSPFLESSSLAKERKGSKQQKLLNIISSLLKIIHFYTISSVHIFGATLLVKFEILYVFFFKLCVLFVFAVLRLTFDIKWLLSDDWLILQLLQLELRKYENL